ncbi:putative secondary metabolism biosynthetic enzyme [Colletotrichum chrysophilum]|uniref:putative secondary metabolism biosynthetic enzyme n=1 Tax=Colletotrichum chrysophilum TaxID=1836956 RepID=UPI002300C59D|nr:putative secondary metabolism biosynthetic enzyme [Colletotrichum chrysophilum]KAJ0372711.1 putative secondary metabolism biosynthetic enzyme [Colletotrichum chrysophilum]
MISPVRFNEAAQAMLSGDNGPNFLIEIGPSGALGGPVSQILKSLSNGSDISSVAAWSRGANAGKTIYDLAGRLFIAGGGVNLAKVNLYSSGEAQTTPLPNTIIDLPNYVWNHSVKYWHENAASKDWRFKQYVNHDLLGSKVLGTTWRSPTWRKLLDIADVPWLKDHKMGDDILLPGSGFITMAVEALYQKTRATAPDDVVVASSNNLSYRLRNVRFDKALVLEEGVEAIITLSLTQQPGSKDWHEFHVATNTAGVFIEHCSGLIRVQEPILERLIEVDRRPLEFPTTAKIWYKAQTAIGYGFGPDFQKVKKVESISGQRHSRSLVSLEEPKSKWSPQSYYPIHPASLDGCFQTVTPSLWAGEHSSLNAVLVPSVIDDLVINQVNQGLSEGLSIASSDYSGRGRLEEAKSYFANCSIHDPTTGALLMQMRGLRFAKLDVVPKPDPHIFDRVSWKPDITFFSQDNLVQHRSEFTAGSIIDLIAHKQPRLRVLESDFDANDKSSAWFQGNDWSSRAAYTQYDYVSTNAKLLVGIQTQNEGNRNASFSLINLESGNLGLPSDAIYDLVIVKVADKLSSSVDQFLQRLKKHLSSSSHTLILQPKQPELDAPAPVPSPRSTSPDSDVPADPSTPSESAGSDLPPETPVTDVSITPEEEVELKEKGRSSNVWVDIALESLLDANSRPELHGFSVKLQGSTWTLYSFAATSEEPHRPRNLDIVRLSQGASDVEPSLKEQLETSGWNITQRSDLSAVQSLSADSTVLILDELHNPVLTNIDGEQWSALKTLVSSGRPLLWVTKGAQLKVTDPDLALAHGLFRVVRREDASVKITVLDVESNVGPNTAWAIKSVLETTCHSGTPSVKGIVETEFAERNGVLYVHRVVPDLRVNEFKRAEQEGSEPVLGKLHETKAAVQLRSERVGTFQSLTWNETDVAEVPVEEGTIEVEVFAVGVNFKDVAVSMGIVPENEYTIGYEAAGIVTRLGPGVTKFKEGDRVCFLNGGSYANRLQVPIGRAHVIPDWMSFEDAATIPSVYLCSIYSLFDIANLKEGQSVLIHSASGGVGIACIQLAQYKNAEIYVTVGTEEKRQFLEENYGIPRSRMFSSRNTTFAKEILAATNGRGIDVIINSLTGELLDASWRIIADGGTLVEIGKKDIVDRNTLSMEPFDRNASFRAMDFSYTQDIRDPLIARLLDEVFALVNSGHIKPIHPITTFGFDAVPAALAYIRSGRHIGKVVISDGSKKDVQVPIRPATRRLKLRSDASYVIVGGLKGLCGSLAIHMARHGAKHIISVSRSGIDDVASQKAIKNCAAYGCEVLEAKGDVANLEFVQDVFKSIPRVAGVIQGAMVLRVRSTYRYMIQVLTDVQDKPYETMTLDDYHTAIHAKFHGTWNLHRASEQLQHPLDFFTLLSSISGIVGNKGQANYSAGNTFLDAFADYRRALGLQANSVDLGLIQDVGYVAEQEGFEARFDTRQWTPITEGTLRKILSYSIPQQDNASATINPESAAQLVTGIGFPLPEDSDLTRDARFGYLFQNTGTGSDGKDGGSGKQGDETIRAFHALHKSGADRTALVKVGVEVVASQLAKILRLETEIEPAKPLMTFGLDSLAAVELRNWIRLELGAELTTLDITNASSLNALGDKLVSKLTQTSVASS